MEIISQQSSNVMQVQGWDQKKKRYKELLTGYESPNGTTMTVEADLATLMFVSVVSESAQRISLMAQSEATDKLIKQAEQHRELLEKNFTDSLARMKAEHEKAISAAALLRDGYARAACEAEAGVDETMQRIERVQGEATINFQIECLRKRALRYESQISEMTIKHDEEMKEKDIVNNKQRKDLLDERNKRKELEKELREYEDRLMSGSMSTTTITGVIPQKAALNCPSRRGPR
jgi:hypothetical protein